MSMPQPFINTLPAETMRWFERELQEALSFHETQLQETAAVDDISMAVRRRSEAAQAEILAALSRIQDGYFGRCEGCGAAIDSDRLQTVPHTRFCRSCAAREGRRSSWR